MIRKHALTLAWGLVAVMTAATLWRISLLPDWSQVTMAGEDGAPLRSLPSIQLFIGPAVLAFAAMAYARSMRRAAGRPEAVQSVRNFGDTLLLAMGGITAVMQGIILSRSLGVVLPYDAIARGGFIVLGIVAVLFGNRAPKLPWVTSKTAGLDDASIQKLRRLNGLWMVILGVAYVLVGAFLQPRQVVWLVLSLTVGGTMAIIAYARWLGRRKAGAAR